MRTEFFVLDHWLNCFGILCNFLSAWTKYNLWYIIPFILDLNLFFNELIFIFLQTSESLLQATVKCLVDVVNCETATIASVAMEALGHIGLRVPLPPLHDSSSGESC